MNTHKRTSAIECLESRTFLSASDAVPGADLLDSHEFGNAFPARPGPNGSSDPDLQRIRQNLEQAERDLRRIRQSLRKIQADSAEPLSGFVRADVFSTVSVG